MTLKIDVPVAGSRERMRTGEERGAWRTVGADGGGDAPRAGSMAAAVTAPMR